MHPSVPVIPRVSTFSNSPWENARTSSNTLQNSKRNVTSLSSFPEDSATTSMIGVGDIVSIGAQGDIVSIGAQSDIVSIGAQGDIVSIGERVAALTARTSTCGAEVWASLHGGEDHGGHRGGSTEVRTMFKIDLPEAVDVRPSMPAVRPSKSIRLKSTRQWLDNCRDEHVFYLNDESKGTKGKRRSFRSHSPPNRQGGHTAGEKPSIENRAHEESTYMNTNTNTLMVVEEGGRKHEEDASRRGRSTTIDVMKIDTCGNRSLTVIDEGEPKHEEEPSPLNEMTTNDDVIEPPSEIEPPRDSPRMSSSRDKDKCVNHYPNSSSPYGSTHQAPMRSTCRATHYAPGQNPSPQKSEFQESPLRNRRGAYAIGEALAKQEAIQDEIEHNLAQESERCEIISAQAKNPISVTLNGISRTFSDKDISDPQVTCPSVIVKKPPHVSERMGLAPWHLTRNEKYPMASHLWALFQPKGRCPLAKSDTLVALRSSNEASVYLGEMGDVNEGPMSDHPKTPRVALTRAELIASGLLSLSPWESAELGNKYEVSEEELKKYTQPEEAKEKERFWLELLKDLGEGKKEQERADSPRDAKKPRKEEAQQGASHWPPRGRQKPEGEADNGFHSHSSTSMAKLQKASRNLTDEARLVELQRKAVKRQECSTITATLGIPIAACFFCPRKHKMEAFRVKDDDWFCSKCDGNIALNQVLCGCRLCDYDTCLKCMGLAPTPTTISDPTLHDNGGNNTMYDNADNTKPAPHSRPAPRAHSLSDATTLKRREEEQERKKPSTPSDISKVPRSDVSLQQQPKTSRCTSSPTPHVSATHKSTLTSDLYKTTYSFYPESVGKGQEKKAGMMDRKPRTPRKEYFTRGRSRMMEHDEWKDDTCEREKNTKTLRSKVSNATKMLKQYVK